MGNTLNQLEDKLNEAMAGKKSAPDVVAVPPELVTAASAAPGPLSTVHAVQILNGEWAANQCDLKDNWAGVKCSNLRAAMAQVGLPAPEEAKAAPLKVDYGPPTLVSEPTQLIAEADAALAKACAERCGFLASALGAAFGGVASYSGFTGSFPAAEDMPEESAQKARAALFTGCAVLGTTAAHSICSRSCQRGPPPKLHYAADEPFVLQGVYEHQAKGEADVEAFRQYAAKSGN